MPGTGLRNVARNRLAFSGELQEKQKKSDKTARRETLVDPITGGKVKKTEIVRLTSLPALNRVRCYAHANCVGMTTQFHQFQPALLPLWP